ncbi:hypothetical protein NJ76_21245 [Rhodococcus sp. IITR03]|nr:hypothetical protein NJ76_21245 [Rhodococcus sp. IITR03]
MQRGSRVLQGGGHRFQLFGDVGIVAAGGDEGLRIGKQSGQMGHIRGSHGVELGENTGELFELRTSGGGGSQVGALGKEVVGGSEIGHCGAGTVLHLETLWMVVRTMASSTMASTAASRPIHSVATA